MNDENLKPCTKENARERQLKSAKKRKENRQKKILMSQIYAEFLAREYDIKVGDQKKKITGSELCNEAMKKIIARGDSSSVSLLKELREGTEGQKVKVDAEVKPKTREELYNLVFGD